MLLIVGGGIGGLATALAAARAGRQVHVIEKSPEFTEIGAGLQLAPNATRMLDRLGVLEDVLRLATFPKNLVMMDALTGLPITRLDLGDAFRAHYGYPYIVMHRGDLLAAELKACRCEPSITLHGGREATAIKQNGDSVDVVCHDGTSFECEAVVGADGLWSHVRKEVHDDGDPICAQYVAYRGTLPLSDAPPETDLQNMTIWVGPEMHFVQYVIHGGTLLNQVAVFRSHRFRPGCDYLEDWGTPDELDRAFAPLCPVVRSAIRFIRRDRRWPMFDRLPIPSWTRGRITLLGDAAHPMLQYIAQGACQALEDSVCLGNALARYPDWSEAFLAYEAERIPRTARVQRTARFFGDLKHLDGVGRSVRNALLQKRSPDDFDYFDFLYGYSPSLVDSGKPRSTYP
jgi:2-polyprenyl-6-methoxyphenol hydroxylase-like FAD-dependent oxidoreductase